MDCQFNILSSNSLPLNFSILRFCILTSCYIKPQVDSSCFPDASAGKESTCNAEDLGSIPGLGRSPGEGNSYPLQYSGLENSMDCIVHGVAKSQTRLNEIKIKISKIFFTTFRFLFLLSKFEDFPGV